MSLNENRTIRPWQSSHWQDWANIVLAVWLFISPWVINFGGNAAGGAGATPGPANGVASTAAWNAWVLGVIIFLVACSAIARPQAWQEWINLLLGIWLFVAPWTLGFTQLGGAAWDHWIVGALVFILAVWNLQTVRSGPVAAEPGYAGRKPDLNR
jgi:hypothetical protein